MNARNYFENMEDSDFKNLSPKARYSFLLIKTRIDNDAKGWDAYETDQGLRNFIDREYRHIQDHYKHLESNKPAGLKERLTVKNYFWKIGADTLFRLPMHLQEEHVYLKVITENGENWHAYKTDERIKQRVKKYLKELNEWLADNGEESVWCLGKLGKKQARIDWVIRLSFDQVILYRYIHLKSKAGVSKEEIRSLINYIRRLMVQKKIGHGTRNIGLIKKIMEYLIGKYAGKEAVAPPPIDDIENLKQNYLVEKLRPAVTLLKLYIGLGGRWKKGKGGRRYLLHKAVDLKIAMDKQLEKMKTRDSYYHELKAARDQLDYFITDESLQTLPIMPGHVYTLTGFPEEEPGELAALKALDAEVEYE